MFYNNKMDIIRVPLRHYVHIKDSISNITYMLEGPVTYALKSHETIVLDITPNLQLGNNQYVMITNPVSRNDKKEIQHEDFGQVKLKWGEEEIRIDQDYKEPFPLYPGEQVKGRVESFLIVQANEELKLQAVRAFYDDVKKKDRHPGDTWMVRGPINFIPRVEVLILEKISALIIKPNTALKVRAVRACTDKYDKPRFAGEEWLIREPGAYLPNVDEEVVDKCVKAYTLTDKRALYLKAACNFTDVYGTKRKAGDEWLVTMENNDTHIQDVNEIFVKLVDITILSSRQYCVIINPVVNGVPQYGKKTLKRGECSFFLQPGELLEDNKTKNVIILDENDALLLKAIEPYEGHTPGDRWMIKGPCEFILPLELELLEKRKAIPLNENEGIYVRDIFTGQVRVISGQTYLLAAHEELWEKELSPLLEDLLLNQKSGSVFVAGDVNETGELVYKRNQIKNSKEREKWRVVTFQAPANSAVQVFDYKELKARVVFGTEEIKLGPHEEFTILSLSGKKPKVENQIKNLAILLGPDLMTDIIEVETRDHARLKLQLSYSWQFKVDKKNKEEALKLFTINDFIGDACKNLAAKIRGAVSTVPFETFHKNSATIVRSAIFGIENGVIKNDIKFESNNLYILNVDIQAQEPCDPKTRENLSKSTNLSIQSINAMQKADAEHKQKMIAEDSKGKLQLQKLEDDTHAERQNIEFLKKKVETEAVKTSGNLKAKAYAYAKENEIKGKSMVDQSNLKVQALDIEVMSGLVEEEINIKEDIKRKEQTIDVEIDKLSKLSSIEVSEFTKTINAIGKETIVAMARAGPQVQAKLLGSLGIKSFLITDGKNPINLFNTAKGLVNKDENN
jgi:major vault protein